MSKEYITKDRVNELLHYDRDKGLFYWKVSRGGKSKGDEAGNINNYGYVVIRLDGVLYKAHRLAMLVCDHDLAGMQVDHINGVRTDNKYKNLRLVSHAGNMHNRKRANKNSSTKCLGVSEKNGKYVAIIQLNSKSIYLGTFVSKEEAGSAYLDAKRKYHETCTI